MLPVVHKTSKTYTIVNTLKPTPAPTRSACQKVVPNTILWLTQKKKPTFNGHPAFFNNLHSLMLLRGVRRGCAAKATPNAMPTHTIGVKPATLAEC